MSVLLANASSADHTDSTLQQETASVDDDYEHEMGKLKVTKVDINIFILSFELQQAF